MPNKLNPATARRGAPGTGLRGWLAANFPEVADQLNKVHRNQRDDYKGIKFQRKFPNNQGPRNHP